MLERVDVGVVGAGPAGLAVAVTAAEGGLRVAVVDAGRQLGGQYWRHPDEGSGRDADGTGHHDWKVFTGLRDRFRRLRGQGLIVYRPSTQVWFVERPASAGGDVVLRLNGVTDEAQVDAVGLFRAKSSEGRGDLQARALVMCPGGYDRQLPVPGWDLPGVLAAGGVQALLKQHGSLAGQRAVVAGTGPFLLPVAAGLAEAGATVVAVAEAGHPISWLKHLSGAVQVPSKVLEGAEYARALIRHRVPYRTRTAVTAITGDSAVESVTLSRLDREGRVQPGSEQTVTADLVALGWGFTPSVELVMALGAETRLDADESLVAVVDDDQRSTVSGIYVAGEATGVGGAMLAVAEGELAGLAVLTDTATQLDERRRRTLHRRVRRGRAFARAMHLAHPIPEHWHEWLTPETPVCRCEEVSHGEMCQARDDLGAGDARTVKLMVRPGMGWCQGRVCGFATAKLAQVDEARELTAEDLRPMAARPLACPVSLGQLAALDQPDV